MTTNERWSALLNEKRPRDLYKTVTDDQKIPDSRNEFERDYDRVVASSSLRRLQDKAQVFPLQQSDFIRTRLTHSIEVSALARSLGNQLERWLIMDKKDLSENDYGKIPSILAVAGLVHDIGNPPFGHYGEDIIKNWFRNWYPARVEEQKTFEEKHSLSSDTINDFLNFDGNAQGIRVLTRLQFLNDRFGINFTFGTLSALIKYPWDSSHQKAIEKQKFGYFRHDQELMELILTETVGSTGIRNPLTYLLEAADDIAYYGADIEDGVKKTIIPWEDVFENEIVTGEIGKKYPAEIGKLKAKHEKAKANGFPDYKLTSVQNYKVWAQGQMIREVLDVFKNNYDDIMSGTFQYNEQDEMKELLKETENARLLRDFSKDLLKKYVFPCKEVLSLELVGDSVVSELLDVFVEECILSPQDYEKEHKCKAGKLFKLISDNFVFVHTIDDDIENPKKTKNINDLDTYSKLLLITDFISGMTDSYALDLHQKLKGVKMP